MVHLYHYFAVDPNSQFFREPRGGYASIATEAKEREVSDSLLRGQLYCFLRLGFE